MEFFYLKLLQLLCHVFLTESMTSRSIYNVALNRPTAQSSTFHGTDSNGSSWHAVDGVLDPGSCASTDYVDEDSWWQVDLGRTYNISQVTVQNTVDQSEMLSNFQIEVAESIDEVEMDLTELQLCYNYTSNAIGPGELKTFQCPASVEGRVVRITKHATASTALRLCEVIVKVNTDMCTNLDLALSKSATQSTTYDDGKDHTGDAWRSVDGNLDPNMPIGQSCSHTYQVGYQWWQVDLGRYYHITQVSIQNRDVVPHRLGNVSVEVSETNNFDIDSEFYDAKLCHYYEDSDVPASTLLILPCSDNIVGRYIRISKFVSILYDVLSFCEVIVEGGDPSCIQGTTENTATTTVTDYTTKEPIETTESPEITSTTKNTSLPSTCPCSCRGSIAKYYNRTIESLLDELREELLVSKTQTATYTRTLVSVDDGRISSRNIGYGGIILLVAVGLTIVVPDVVSLAMYIKGK